MLEFVVTVWYTDILLQLCDFLHFVTLDFSENPEQTGWIFTITSES